MWMQPRYSYGFNVISDLGNTVCGQYFDRYVCSPGYLYFNASLVLLGVTMLIGSALLYRAGNRSRLSRTAFFLMGLSGVGTLLVGLFPENTISLLHGLGAILALGVGNVALIIFAFALTQTNRIFRIYTLLTGVVALSAFVLFILRIDLGLGAGGIERIAGHPQTIWLTVFGMYMCANWVRTRRSD